MPSRSVHDPATRSTRETDQSGHMANRDELMIIRSARVGQAAAQLALGKWHLFGGGLPQSLATALYWLERAAEQKPARRVALDRQPCSF